MRADSIPARSTTLGAVIGVVDLMNEHRGVNTEADRARAVGSCLQPGKPYGPWCPIDQPCHADVLLKIANAPDRTW